MSRVATYDLSRFDNRQLVREQVSRERAAVKKRTAVKTRKKSISAFSVLSYIICMGLLVTMIFSFVSLTEVSDSSAKLTREYEKMCETTQLMEIQKTQKFGAEKVRRYATEVLGMRKLDKTQITYVNLGTEDKAVVLGDFNSESDKGELAAGISRGLSYVLEYLN